MLDHLQNLDSEKRLSLFGKIIQQEEERKLQTIRITIPPEQEFKQKRTENEAHLETIMGDNHDEVI